MSEVKTPVITELDSLDAIRLRYSMFIASRGVNQLLLESIDNAIDEGLAGRNKYIDIFHQVDENNDITWYVRDKGNGIPLKTNNDTDGIISIATKLYSGAKYDNELYKGSTGLNGLGCVIINALSKRLTITTLAHDEGNNHWQYFFKDGKFITKQLVHLKGSNIYSTEIRFVPDPARFETLNIDENMIISRLHIARYILDDDVTIRFEGNEIENIYLDKFKGDNCADLISELYKSKSTDEICKLNIALYDDFDSGKIFKGIVNTIECNEGTHKNVVQNLLKNKLVDLAEKNKKTIQPNDVFIPIRINCILQLVKTGFEEQVKSTLAVDKGPIVNLVEPLLDDMFKKNKDFFMKVIEKSEEYRINLESNKQARKGKNGKSVKCEGLYECISKNPEERSLYIVEGDSAGGSIVSARRPKYDAVLPLMGKLLNVVGTDKKIVSKAEIVKNKVIATLATALGYKIFGDIDPKKCRYKNIFLVADADPDGKTVHI